MVEQQSIPFVFFLKTREINIFPAPPFFEIWFSTLNRTEMRFVRISSSQSTLLWSLRGKAELSARLVRAAVWFRGDGV
jgi:hypothetical protein